MAGELSETLFDNDYARLVWAVTLWLMVMVLLVWEYTEYDKFLATRDTPVFWSIPREQRDEQIAASLAMKKAANVRNAKKNIIKDGYGTLPDIYPLTSENNLYKVSHIG